MLHRDTTMYCFLSWEEMFLYRSKEMQHKGNAILTNFKGVGVRYSFSFVAVEFCWSGNVA